MIRNAAECVMMLAEYFGVELSEAVLSIYLEGLKDIDAARLQDASKQAILTLKFMPKVAELRELSSAGDVMVSDRGVLAWSEAWGQVSSRGSYRSPILSDQIAVETIEAMGGWTAFCLPDCEEQWHRKAFLETYAVMDRRAERLMLPPSDTEMKQIMGRISNEDMVK